MSITVQKKLKRRLKKFIIVLFGLYIMIGSALYFFQEKILFLPTTLEQDYQYQFNFNFEELFLKTDDDALINALHFKVENPKGVILYFHGNAGDLSRWGIIAEYFVEMNYDVLVMDYRTYGKSTGKLSEKVLYSDAQFCYNYLLKHYSEKQITLYGRSLGTGIASQLASINKPNQLILETPYYSILDVAEHRFPMFPVKKLLKYHFPTFQYLPKTDCSVTIIHGTDDSVVPYSSSKKLSELNLQNLNFVTVDGGNHNNLIEFEAYHKIIKSVLK
ncbi:alpha/beta hydrolase [Winogradskyella echinorum]|uniref:Alpha/beta hydrolase n=2 Tax=Winogradskyella echinorum TaxID=538189 RepID=A0ABR6Y452_9FLAO|nr:alpha/beta hydrolase [Winogradskyella echinorum]MBC5751875.1 alpha/beta hydrolase [Winogradskyella echinorum]